MSDPPESRSTSAVAISDPENKDADVSAHSDVHGNGQASGEQSSGMKNSKGWDGKLRLPKSVLVTNPEALSDPDYSDDSNVLPGEEIEADQDLLSYLESDTWDITYTHARITSLPSLNLERFKELTDLCLRQNNIQNIESLAQVAPKLEQLDLYDNLISHMRGLDGLTNLTSLDLSFNKIKHIKHIDGMAQLRELYLVANKISRIEGLQGLHSLTMLELGSNRIRELQNLDCLKNLKELWIAKNKISQLKGLAGLSSLRLLSIQSNRIRDLSPLREVPGLEELYISHNALESLDGLEQNTKLQTLDISNNKVQSLKGLENLSNLEELWASYNQLGDFGDVEKVLADKTSLTTVYFEGNPMQLRAPVLYRNKVRLALPQIKQIDATFVKAS
ncbi:hypothetical protein CDD81_4504 [Ophiocordyceps australis]|uniref:Protein phosphatase 1 regulatory subunit 7 n=1 Tax=Ophiocordyceps australis TaxID=1399860 RepID=A0A2C5XCB3_9HYPO|nr:hypothetical protein CDD81_4504 [Ophiocordyceps australis]